MEKKPKDKDIKKAIDDHIRRMEAAGDIKIGKRRNKSKDAPISLTAEKVIAAKNRYLSEKHLHKWKKSRFMISIHEPFEYDYQVDGIIDTEEYKMLASEE